MAINYYLAVFPTESLIASELGPEEFGSYMAIGSRKGSNENLIFVCLKGEFGSFFDWEYAHERCVPHADGRPKHSLYLSVYRALENIPLDMLGDLYLVTQDGRSLALQPTEYVNQPQDRVYYVYKELCPISPLVVSSLAPRRFGTYLTSGVNRIHVPKIIFADLKVVDPDDPEHTGNVGRVYENRLEHLRDCIGIVTTNPAKVNKTFNRSNTESFTYQVIRRGLYAADSQEIVMYPMKTEDELRDHHYHWARSARIF
jgi:hypothetical protein